MDFSTPLLFFSIFVTIAAVNGNSEGDALANWRAMLDDPNNVLQSWDSTLVNPCTWFHVTCNNNNSVIRVDLGNAGLSGPLSPGLAQLNNLAYLSLFGNNLTGVIPPNFGDLTNMVVLDLSYNHLSGYIPSTLANLKSMIHLRLNGNALTGYIPTGILELATLGNLRVLNVSENYMTGRERVTSTRPRDFVTTTIIQDPRAS